MTSKAKASPASHTTSVTHGNTTTTTTHKGAEVTTARTVKSGDHRTQSIVVKKNGKVISEAHKKYLVAKAKPKAATAKKKTTAKRGAPGPCADGFWVTADNHVLPSCVAAAVANSYLIATGLRAADWQLRALAGMQAITDVLGRLDVPFRPADGLHDGVILGIAGEHAVTVHDGALVSWGAEYPLDGLGAIEEAWEPHW